MNIISGIRSYISDSDLKIVVLNNKINIVNYIDIPHFDSNTIVVTAPNQEIFIKGKNLVVSKLMSDEVLITGDFNVIEFR